MLEAQQRYEAASPWTVEHALVGVRVRLLYNDEATDGTALTPGDAMSAVSARSLSKNESFSNSIWGASDTLEGQRQQNKKQQQQQRNSLFGA